MKRTSNFHQRLIDILRQRQMEDPYTGSSIFSLSDDLLVRSLFSNYRTTGTSTNGLRLTYEGLNVFEKYFQSYEVKFEQLYNMKPKHVVFLDKKTSMPWFLSSTKVVFFELDLAMQFKMMGDFDNLIACNSN